MTIKKISVNGKIESVSASRYKKTNNNLKVQIKHSVSFMSNRAGGSSVVLDKIEKDDVMQLEFVDGIKIFTRVDDFQKDYSQINQRSIDSRTDRDTLEIKPGLTVGDANRGAASMSIKALEILGVEPAEGAAIALAGYVEKGLNSGPGLFSCRTLESLKEGQDNYLKLETINHKFEVSKPTLLFIHGTASSTTGSFSELWAKPKSRQLNQITAYYGKQIYAFEHRTLTQSPVENAIELVEALQEKIEEANKNILVEDRKVFQLDLVSHSRGGLVGELLSRVDVDLYKKPFSEIDIERYKVSIDNVKELEQQDKDLQVENLRKLSKLLDKKISDDPDSPRLFTIHRFVRTACPALGTSLASGRLDKWGSVIFNAMGYIPVLKGSILFEAFTEFLLAVIKTKSKPDVIPGLAAQMPGSPLVKLLNLTRSVVDGDLSVISGDIEPDSTWGKLKFLIPDLYFGHNHDLVVDTMSMMGGTARKDNKARCFFDQGDKVTHFNYFKNEKTVDRLVAGLIRKDDDLAGYTSKKIDSRLMSDRSEQVSGEKPVVFVIPGIMGSHLEVGNNRVWIDVLELAFGGLKRLKINSKGVKAESLVDMAYEDLVEFLESKGNEVVTFPYDWRISIETEAKRFVFELEKKIKLASSQGKPVHIVAHSMGGLVSRMAFALNPTLWGEFIANKGRFIMLGTPSRGSHIVTSALVGQEDLVNYLALLDFSHSKQEVVDIISKYPGFLQMLPIDTGVADVFDTALWQEFKETINDNWPLPTASILKQAKSFWEKIDSFKLNHENMIYIAGKAKVTPQNFEIVTRFEEPEFDESQNRGGNNNANKNGKIEVKKVVFHGTSQGDGRVTWESGIPANIRSWYMDATHGDLASTSKAFPAIVDLLNHGDTTDQALSISPISTRGEAITTFEITPKQADDMLPDNQLLMRSALGMQHKIQKSEVPAKLHVSIAHGDLSYASHSLVLGHYKDDLIISAESYVNHVFDDRLRKRMLLGRYPGELNTSAVIKNPNAFAKPESVVIIGLGKLGELTRQSLSETFCNAAISYALSRLENEESTEQKSLVLKLSCLLIGTGAGGISVSDSLLALTKGLLDANEQLQKVDCNNAHFSELEIIERWQDSANTAAHEFRAIDEDPNLQGKVSYKKAVKINCGRGSSSKTSLGAHLKILAGGLSRIRFEEAEGWWCRMQIHHIKNENSLRFNALTDKARTEVSLQAINLSQVDEFIRQSMSSSYDDPEVSKTLYEMLMPYEFKQQASSRRNVVLVLNEKAARYPWELLQDRWANINQANSSQESLPIAVEFGMIRQLESRDFRPMPVTRDSNALVIGNPLGDSDSFPSLSGAIREAQSTIQMLSGGGYRVKSVIGEDPATDARKVILALHQKAYRIMHFAGHGVYKYELDSDSELCDTCGQNIPGKGRKDKVTGMIIGDNVFLTPRNVKNIRFVPELVFINCCHLGREDGDKVDPDSFNNRHKLAANLATEFIRLGAKAVIAAGWAVNDSAAEIFSMTFYERMLAGVSFGESVRHARAETYKQYKQSNTWGAYQCYGNPDFCLTLNNRSDNNNIHEEVVSEAELISMIEQQKSLAGTSNADYEDIERHLDGLAKVRPDVWDSSAVCEALGHAYNELGQETKAIQYYELALEKKGEYVSLKSVEQLAHMKIKLALKSHLDPENDRRTEDLGDVISESIDILGGLNTYKQTSERYSLLGSAYKRLAWIMSSEKTVKPDLEKMTTHYQKASELSPEDSYPLFNYLTSRMIIHWPVKGKESKEWMKIKDQVRDLTAAEDNNGQQNNFWDLVKSCDYPMLRSLVFKTIANEKETLIKKYENLIKRAGSPKKINSVLEHIQFLIRMAELQLPETDKDNILSSLKEIKEVFDKAEK